MHINHLRTHKQTFKFYAKIQMNPVQDKLIELQRMTYIFKQNKIL